MAGGGGWKRGSDLQHLLLPFWLNLFFSDTSGKRQSQQWNSAVCVWKALGDKFMFTIWMWIVQGHQMVKLSSKCPRGWWLMKSMDRYAPWVYLGTSSEEEGHMKYPKVLMRPSTVPPGDGHFLHPEVLFGPLLPPLTSHIIVEHQKGTKRGEGISHLRKYPK